MTCCLIEIDDADDGEEEDDDEISEDEEDANGDATEDDKAKAQSMLFGDGEVHVFQSYDQHLVLLWFIKCFFFLFFLWFLNLSLDSTVVAQQ